MQNKKGVDHNYFLFDRFLVFSFSLSCSFFSLSLAPSFLCLDSFFVTLFSASLFLSLSLAPSYSLRLDDNRFYYNIRKAMAEENKSLRASSNGMYIYFRFQLKENEDNQSVITPLSPIALKCLFLIEYIYMSMCPF